MLTLREVTDMRGTSLRARGRTPALFTAVVLVVMVIAASAQAAHAYVEISIPIDTVVDAERDSTTQLATADVPEGFAGHMCTVFAHAENQTSVHKGNDLVVASGTSQVVLSNVEAEPGQVVEATEQLELGELITVSLIMGPDEVFSAGIDVSVECLEEEPTTSTTTTTTTAEVASTEVTTTTLPTTTTSAAVIDTEVTTPDASSSTSIADEVLGTEVLPFTGVASPGFGMLGLALLASGALFVAGARRIDD